MSQEECHGNAEKVSAEFKREAVALTAAPDVSVAQVARDLGIGANLLGRWRREFHADGTQAFQGTGVVRDEEVARLKRELARVRREREFLNCTCRRDANEGWRES